MNEILDLKHELLRSRAGSGPGAELILGLLTTARKIDAACAEILARYGLSEGRLAVLLAVSDTPGIAPGQVAEQLGVTRATVTGLTDALEKSALLERAAVSGDRRSLSLRTTSAGEALVAELSPIYRDWLTVIAVDVSADQERATSAALAAIQRRLDETP
ncbi:MarR family transcriptional regulator [Microbacterium sp. CBA3102]|uniref:MarR family winged helix-turn-helix transcriptional regulator n=1 Tax=Microbacterium sp. CBA3102 TaxID=2603598 RepID=UPI0011BBDC48|nr:MarR family transcriptional regulator [Microbacterium sp. CBA3102]QEA30048.1 MarR family transcriptional regulator [Microbacterium sp. CBA3102]